MHGWLMPACLAAVFVLAPSELPRAETADYCSQGETPTFRAGFRSLSDDLGPLAGAPTTCEYPDPAGTGDVEQNTSTGLAFWRKSTNIPTFTNGFDHWALTLAGLVHWTGSSVDPPLELVTGSDLTPFLGVWAGHGRTLEVLDSGEVHYTYRTYNVCGRDPPPCDSVVGNAIVDGGRVTLKLDSLSPTMAVGSVVSSTDPKYPAGADATLTFDANDALRMHIDDTDVPPLCGPTAPAGECGA